MSSPPSRTHTRSSLDTESVTKSPPSTHLHGWRLGVAFLSLLMGLLLTALDQTILATALPRIASEFHNFTLQGWVATSFVLSQSVFLLLYSQALRIFPSKWVLIVAMVIFELGSLVCALSNDIETLICGRVVSGVGAAGLYVPVLQIISEIVPLERRPTFYGLLGAAGGVASIVGPLVGGVFTDHVSWRWCFWINLPIGGLSVFLALFTLSANPPLGSDPTKRSRRDMWIQAAHMDYIGLAIAAGAITCLNLALQWGGNIKPWGDPGVITCFVLTPFLIAVLLIWEKYVGEDTALIPLYIFKSVSVYAVMVYCFFNRWILLLYGFYMPIYYQAARHHSATRSGSDLLPFLLTSVVAVIVSGVLIGRSGRYWHWVVAGPVFTAIGAGLLYTVTPTTSLGALAGFQILLGFGLALGMQSFLLAIQVEFKSEPKFLSQATGFTTVSQMIGGTIGLGIAEPIYSSRLSANLAKYAPTAPEAIVRNAPTAIWDVLSGDVRENVIRVYTESLRVVYVIGVPVAGLAILAALCIKDYKIEKEEEQPTEPVVGGEHELGDIDLEKARTPTRRTRPMSTETATTTTTAAPVDDPDLAKV